MLDLSRLKIAFIAGTLGPGGAERQLFYMLDALKRSGASPHLFSLTSGEFWERSYRNLGVPVTWIGRNPSKLVRLACLMRNLRKDPPHLIQSQHFYTNLYAAVAGRTLGIREIAALRSDGTNEVKANGPFFGRLSLRLPRVLVANSRTAIKAAIEMGVPSPRLHLLKNVVDTRKFEPTRRNSDAAVTLLAAGRLADQKRMDRFLRVLSNLHRHSGIPVKGLIVGDGPLKGELETQAAALELLPGIVEFRGVASDMTSVYREADILVLTSDWEGTPNVVLEAMASGLPVVATRVGGMDDLIRQGTTGRLVDCANEDEMTRLLLELVRSADSRRQLGSGARDYIESNHSLHRLPGRLAEIYGAVLS